MEHDNLIKSMEASAEENKAEMQHKAEKKAAEIKNDAMAKAEEIKKPRMESAVKAAMQERNERLFAANNEAKTHLASLKYELFNEAFEQARARLGSLRESGYYEDTFRQMAAEAIKTIGEDEVVLHVDKRDADLCRKVVDGMGKRCEIVADISCSGGLNASTKDLKISALNTVEYRLEKARQRMKLEIFSILGDRR
jgi:V/A-type H+-transporting ATPase subunit E